MNKEQVAIEILKVLRQGDKNYMDTQTLLMQYHLILDDLTQTEVDEDRIKVLEREIAYLEGIIKILRSACEKSTTNYIFTDEILSIIGGGK